MRIEQVLLVPGHGGHYNDDLDAIRAGANRDGYFYTGAPLASGFSRVREPAEAFSIVLLLETMVRLQPATRSVWRTQPPGAAVAGCGLRSRWPSWNRCDRRSPEHR